ncbi:MAG TPA: cytochrome P450 [Methylomirabilota bacterium]|nr:cytochrome P450 [Methylomirabilota bacterium]
MDPISAVTHPDPYPYYAELVAQRPIHRDETLELWVAAGAEAVTAVLTSERCRVRPPGEPVPRALLGSPAGEIFGHLVRMNDGVTHTRLKPGVAARVASIDPGRIAEQGARWAQQLASELDPVGKPDQLAEFAFRLPVYVVASLLGVAPTALAETASRVRDFARCLAPGATPAELERGGAAAGHLGALFAGLLRRDGVDAVVANTVGYLSQAYEATAGLIGNTLLALARQPGVRDRVRTEPQLLPWVVREVARHDSPVQNTRRFLAEGGVVAGQAMKPGDTVLVVLAAANLDPAANPHPDQFDPLRRVPRSFTFGLGAHACPGEVIATTIARTGVESLLAAGVDPERLAGRVTYRPSANMRIPLFGKPA